MFVVDDERAKRDIAVIRQSEKLRSKYEELLNALKEDPYHIPPKFVPSNGLKYHKKYYGKQLYHAKLTSSDRVFYTVINDEIIIVEVEYQGVVEIIQALGHFF